jgi:hypothetical protein
MQAASDRLHEAFGGIDKGFAGQSMGGEHGLATDNTASKKRMSFSSASDMSKQQVEDLVTKLTIDEMKTKWFDEIYCKVKSERELPTHTWLQETWKTDDRWQLSRIPQVQYRTQ